MSVNARLGQADPGQVLKAVEEEEADLLVVSEVTAKFVAMADAQGLSRALPHRLGQSRNGAGGTMVFSRWEAARVANVPTVFDSFVVEAGGTIVLAAHPAPPTLGDRWQADQRTLLIAARRYEVDLVVGDLNASLDHPTLRDLVDAGWRDSIELANHGFEPTWPVDTAIPLLGLLPPMVQIDHVMVSSDWAVIDTGGISIEGTDHKVVYAEVSPAA
jgi:hypothetical protein